MSRNVSSILPGVVFCWLLLLFLYPSQTMLAQQTADTTAAQPAPAAIPPDTVETDTTQADTLTTPARIPESGAKTIPGNQQRGAENSQQNGEGSVQFQATDSLVFDFQGDREARLYGSAQVTHTAGKLTAGKVALNLDRNIVRAQTETPEDTLSQPVLEREERKIRSNRIAFNYKSEKGRFDVARVNIKEGKLTGNKVKKAEKEVVYIEDGIYSTCKLPHPHYYLKADRMKVVDREEIFFTNARLYLLDIPYPLVFPFGYVPAKIEQRQSGILEPTYAFQNQASRGIGLQNLGWFQYFNDYLTGQLEFNIYTSGTFLGDLKFDYAKRNDFNGSISIGYSRERGLEKTDPDFGVRTNKRLSISHNQDFSPYANISANINLRTADYYQRNSYDPDERAQTSTTSRLSYNYNAPSNNYSFNISASQSHDFKNNTATFSAPNISFNVNSFSPFRNATSRGEETSWYENLSLNYSSEIQSDFSYRPIAADSAKYGWFETLWDPAKYRDATDNNEHYRIGMRHNGSISLNNLLSSQFYNTNLSLRLTEYWYPNTIRKSWEPTTDPQQPDVVTRKVQGFTAARDFNTNFGINTRIYGIWNRSIGSLQSFRHTLEPRISFSYRPDFSTDFWGYYRQVQVDSSGRTRQYSIFENGVVGGPSRGEQRRINFSLGNTFEAKQVKRDSTGEKNENNIRLIDRLDASIGYNFAADSLKLSDLDISYSTNIRDFTVNGNATFNLYSRDADNQLVDRLLITESDRLAQLTRFSLNVGTRFSSKGRSKPHRTQYQFPRRYDPFNQSEFRSVSPRFNAEPVADIDAPWSFSLNFSYSWNYSPRGENRKSAILNVERIQFRLSPKWRVQTRIGYDFVDQNLTPSRFTLNRELHMWDLSFQMNPFGEFQFYLFSLRINNSQLQSLFQKLPILKNLERSSGNLGRGRYR